MKRTRRGTDNVKKTVKAAKYVYFFPDSWSSCVKLNETNAEKGFYGSIRHLLISCTYTIFNFSHNGSINE